MSDPRVRLLFEPNSVAIVGASSDPTKASGLPLRNIAKSKFTGKIYPVNPRASEISGFTCYPSVSGSARSARCGDFDGRCQSVARSFGRMRQERRQDCDHRLGGFQRIGSGRSRAPGTSRRNRQDIRHPRLRSELPWHVQRAQKYSLRLRSLLSRCRSSPGPSRLPRTAAHCSVSSAIAPSRQTKASAIMVSNGNEMDLDLCDFTEFFLEDENTKVVAVLMEGLEERPALSRAGAPRARDRQDHRRAQSRQVGARRDHDHGAYGAHGRRGRSL